MAPSYYEALPIFRAAMDCAVRISAAVDKFPKGHKYTLGAKLRDGSEKTILLVARSNRRNERQRAFDSFSSFSQVIEQVVGLARQAEAWRRSTVPKESIASRPEPAQRPPSGGS